MNHDKLNQAIADDQNKPYGWYCSHCAEYNREPNYTGDRDKIAEAVSTMTDEEYNIYAGHLIHDSFDADKTDVEGKDGRVAARPVIEATALERSIAFAKARNLNYE